MGTLRLLLCGLVVLLVGSVLSGCPPPQPVYRTTYSYTPPEAEQGRTCAMQCEVNRGQCEQMAGMRQDTCTQRADMNFDQCETEATAEHDACLERQRTVRGTLCIRRQCLRDHCSDGRGECETQYNRCFQVCGGNVQENRECVQHCQNAGGSAR